MQRIRVRLLAAAVVGAAVLGGLPACGGDDDTASSPYCARIADINALDLLADPTPPAVQHDLEQLLALTRRAASVAPTEIRADMREAVDAQVEFNTLYESHGWDPAPTQRDPAFIAIRCGLSGQLPPRQRDRAPHEQQHPADYQNEWIVHELAW